MIIGVAGLLILDLLVLPWFSFGATITVGSTTLSIGGSATAVDAPDAWLGVLALLVGAAIKFSAFTIPVGTLIVFVIAAILAGLIAAILPARRAARLNVLEALQYE